MINCCLFSYRASFWYPQPAAWSPLRLGACLSFVRHEYGSSDSKSCFNGGVHSQSQAAESCEINDWRWLRVQIETLKRSPRGEPFLRFAAPFHSTFRLGLCRTAWRESNPFRTPHHHHPSHKTHVEYIPWILHALGRSLSELYLDRQLCQVAPSVWASSNWQHRGQAGDLWATWYCWRVCL